MTQKTALRHKTSRRPGAKVSWEALTWNPWLILQKRVKPKEVEEFSLRKAIKASFSRTLDEIRRSGGKEGGGFEGAEGQQSNTTWRKEGSRLRKVSAWMWDKRVRTKEIVERISEGFFFYWEKARGRAETVKFSLRGKRMEWIRDESMGRTDHVRCFRDKPR